jgi:hypothetical protein
MMLTRLEVEDGSNPLLVSPNYETQTTNSIGHFVLLLQLHQHQASATSSQSAIGAVDCVLENRRQMDSAGQNCHWQAIAKL